MRKYILKCVTWAVILIMICVNVCAAEMPYSVSVDYANNKVTLEGTAPEKAEQIIMQILSKDKSFDDLEAAAGTDVLDMSVILWNDQVSVSEDGTFKFIAGFSPELSAGNYNAYIVASGMEDTRTEFMLSLTGSEAYAETIEKLNEYAEAVDKENFALLIKDNDGVSQMGFDLSLYDKVTRANKLDAYMEYVAENNLTSDDSEYNKKMFNTFMLMETLKQGGVVSNIDLHIYDTIYAGTELVSDYEKYITNQTEQQHMTEKLSGGEYDTLKEFEKAIEVALVLTTVYYADGYGEVKKILSDYGSAVGISGSASNSIYKKLSGNDYEDADDLLSAYNELKGPGSGGSSGGGGGGSSSGGGGGNSGVKDNSSSVGGVFQQPETTENQAEKIEIPFIDIEDIEWASAAIIALADKGIISGKGDGYFMPNDNITREEFVKILVNAMGYGAEAYGQNVFADVKESDWFCSYVNIAYNKNLVNGIGNGLFGTGKLISRQDMVVMLYNALKMKGAELEAKETTFDDKNEIAGYALTAVNTLYTMGVVNGVSDSEFDPLGNATRASAAKVVYGLLKYLQ